MNRESLARLRSFLKDSGIEDYDFEARIIEQDMPGRELETAKRRAMGEPLQYLLGEWEFYGLPFKVGEGVLIPRPDTETLVDAALDFLKDTASPVIIDLCSGSGCIAVTLKKLIPKACVYAIEISEDAVYYLNENIKINNVDVTVVQGDITDPKLARRFPVNSADCIVSNPPYLTDAEMAELQKEVTYEPSSALRGGRDGLDFYRVIPKIWGKVLKKGGLLAFEVGYRQSEAVCDILRADGYKGMRAVKDLGGNDRVVLVNG